jgi:hypothetical protein
LPRDQTTSLKFAALRSKLKIKTISQLLEDQGILHNKRKHQKVRHSAKVIPLRF